MAGGVGSRFWPKSRESFPKQFIDIMGTGKSFLQMTYDRSLAFSKPENILVLTHVNYKNLVAEQLPEIAVENIIAEPSRNNTAPCIAYAAYKLLRQDPEAVMVVMPSDHLILKENAFGEKIKLAINFLQNHKALITLGIQPTRPDTGYGYIQFEDEAAAMKKVKAFKEKPDAATAQKYINSGHFLWNAGIFIWKAKDIIHALEKYAPNLSDIFSRGSEFYNTPAENTFIQENYPRSEKISIDYAIMEKADNVYTIPADIGWSDVGTWASLWNVKEKDIYNNALIAREKVIINNTAGTIVSLADDTTAVIDGLKDFIVVSEKDALLIYPINKEQEIKEMLKTLDKSKL